MSVITEPVIKPINYPIIDHLGQLYSRTKKNRRDEDEYELVKDSPILRYSPIIDSRIAITEIDNRLYDVKNSKYLEVCYYDNQPIDLINLSFKSVVVNTTETMMLALTDNGDLYQATIDGNIICRFRMIDMSIKFITRGYGSSLISIKKNKFHIRHDDGMVLYLALPKGEEVIDVQSGILITYNHVVILREDDFNMIKYDHRLICCGIVPVYNEVRDRRKLYLALMEEDNGELVTRFCDPNHNGDDKYRNDEVYNSQLVKMHRQSPWIEIIIINDDPHLLNVDGVTLEIRDGWATTGTKIPDDILSTNNRIKSMR